MDDVSQLPGGKKSNLGKERLYDLRFEDATELSRFLAEFIHEFLTEIGAVNVDAIIPGALEVPKSAERALEYFRLRAVERLTTPPKRGRVPLKSVPVDVSEAEDASQFAQVAPWSIHSEVFFEEGEVPTLVIHDSGALILAWVNQAHAERLVTVLAGAGLQPERLREIEGKMT